MQMVVNRYRYSPLPRRFVQINLVRTRILKREIRVVVGSTAQV